MPTLEELAIKKIRGGMLAIKNGSKSPEEVSLSYSFGKLQELNEGMYEDYILEYDRLVKDYNRKQNNQ